MTEQKTRRLAIGDRVRSRVDPRQVGEVRRFYAGCIAEVRWAPRGWIEYIPAEDLVEDKK